MNELIKIFVSSNLNGLMIKEILFDHYRFSRKSLSTIKNYNGIYLNGEAVYVSVRVKEGDLLQIFVPEETSTDILPQPIPIDIQYEDQDIVIINKPVGIVVHPTRSHYLGTIANGLMYYWQSQGKQFRFRPVHRLDKDTSGLFIVAKNQYAHHKLAVQIQDNSLKRIYHAIVHGKVAKQSGVINVPILKDPNHAVKRIIPLEDHPEAKTAITYYKIVEELSNYTLIELQLATGRTHQIRVHMSWLQHPLVGDDLYGGELVEGMDRQALHALKLEFYHPITNELLSFKAPIPTDMTNFLTQNR